MFIKCDTEQKRGSVSRFLLYRKEFPLDNKVLPKYSKYIEERYIRYLEGEERYEYE